VIGVMRAVLRWILRGGLLLLLILGIAFSLGYFAYLYKENQWHYRFEAQMQKYKQAQLADLVDFQWDEVFVMGSYDLTVPIEHKIFGSTSRFWRYRWNKDPNYWTVIYRRPNAEPFVIRMNNAIWSLPRRGYRWSSDKSVTLRWVEPDDPSEAKQPGGATCWRHPRNLGHCLVIEDGRTR
jgi:hypothetical protein